MSLLAQQGKKDMLVRRFVERLCAQVEPGDYSSEILAIYYWCCANVRYMKDILDVETLKTPNQLLQSRSGDCDDIATLLAAMYMSCGNVCRFIVVAFASGYPEHVFVQVRVGPKWVTIDPVAAADTTIMHKKVTRHWVFAC